ncbi:MAG: TonB-dependent receptor [Candidatus Marinimicrobia bacterium]|jgi:outer membrane cobalamin receptor|nr:TonB-dependent receptor [Candidatus Neomarinimicrobiota bacterium]MBT3617440.1 TonB-dependent receptor [Candidatus Neomarinimicrobiota bacterium]MBT3829380.1 TonB-dependent receptor [Candidatus Neomarinimicrobiota bacterium]MBT3997663.1 TonB-dependent receptor [Candidatus Neomarinimicrobiota bacterium]MBT4280961.1 TonB-dependent receptor [Candidatus Neomarinimicrobiota bacterium]
MSKLTQMNTFLFTFLLPLALYAQGSISGTVTDASTGNGLAGANVVVDGTNMGAAANASGTYSIDNVPAGTYIVTASVIGYESSSEPVTVSDDAITADFSLASTVISLSALEVLASRAGENSPVAYSNISKEDLQLRLGSRDIPLILNTVPSVYSTGQGGGAGDARINVRGFNQRNVAIMINGVPVNDMENGWVYWSNWDGVSDATSSIQMQKGLSAVNLATPSIGGSMNVITDPTAQERRGLFKQEVGNDGFLKTTGSFHSGLIMNDKLAVSGTVVRKTGTGYVQGTWTDAWAYYIGASFNASKNHRFELYALGAPQRHGQSLYKQNIAVYDSNYALSLATYDENALASNGGEFIETGRSFNQNVANISASSQAILDAATGQQHWQMYGKPNENGVARHESSNLSERENFFHKPQVSLNHYWTLNEKMHLSSILYWSGGMGGGTGTYGTIVTTDANGKNDLGTAESNWYKYYYGPSPWVRDWDATIAANASDGDTVYAYKKTFARAGKESIGILRNSNNRQSTIGAISKLNFDVNENLKTQVGIDWRSAMIYHVKTIRDLLGGEYFINEDSDYDGTDQQKGLGDPIDYNFTNTVDWLGLFAQAEWNSGPLSAYGMFGSTTVKYTHLNHFKKASLYNVDTLSTYVGSYIQAKDLDEPSTWWGANRIGVSGGGQLYIEATPITTFQVKGGLMMDLGSGVDVWANFGLVDKAPIFDQVIQDWDSKYAEDPTNEKFTSYEVGINSTQGNMAVSINAYNTLWQDRIATKYVQNLEGDDNIIYLTGINQKHTGVEAQIAYQFSPSIRLDLGAGIGDWSYLDDASGTYRSDSSGTEKSYSYALEGLKVGDMPQSNMIAGLTISPIEGASIQLLYRHYMNHYADWDPTSREYTPGDAFFDRKQSWKSPDFGILDIHAYYNLPIKLGPTKPKLFLHVFNALDEKYIQDAADNSEYNSYDQDHDADDAEVFFGLPMSINAGVSIAF